MNQVHHKKRTNREFLVNVQIENYDMNNIVLDLGSDVNVIQRKTWNIMGHLNLIWSPIQLRLVNQHKTIPIGILTGVSVSIDGVRSLVDFKVIKIIDGSTPYLALLGLDWTFENQNIIDLKKIQMIFEFK
jgi:hypothetical protein